MYDEDGIGYVDTYEEDLKALFDKVSKVVDKFNSTTMYRQLAATVHRGKLRYAEIDIVDAIYEDVTLYTAFSTKINKTTGKFIVPLDAMINEEELLRSIEAKLSFGLFQTLIKQKEEV